MRGSAGVTVCLLWAALFAAPARAAPSVADQISRIEIEGVQALSDEQIQSELEIFPGERVDAAKITQSEDNLKELYRVHGYEKSAVKSVFSRGILSFFIDEGSPTRIAEIRFFPGDTSIRRNEKFRNYWNRISPELQSKLDLPPGSIFDQEKITAAKRTLQAMLAAEEFVGARIEDIRIFDVSMPGNLESKTLGPVSKWVRVEMDIDLGDRVTFGFRGNSFFTRGYLSSLIEAQRLLGYGKDYSTQIKNRILDEYRASGFARASVEVLTFEKSDRQEHHTTFVIQEGKRVLVDSIEFDGNISFSKQELLKQFDEKSPPILRSGYFVEAEINRSADALVDWMRSRGYLSAKLITTQVGAATETPDSVRVLIYLYEGEQTQVRSIILNGIHAISRERLLELLKVQEGSPLNLSALTDGIAAIKSAYRALGYAEMKILNEGSETVVRYAQQNRTADIQLVIDEGEQYRVGRIDIEGLQLTREHVLRRELFLQEGDLLEEPKLNESEAQLRRIGIFSSVNVDVTDGSGPTPTKNVRIGVQEATPGVVAGGVGLRNDLGIRVFSQAAYTNLGGRNQTIALNINANRRFENFHFVEHQSQLSYIWPWFGTVRDLTFRPSISFGRTQYFEFDASNITFALTLEKKLLRQPNLTGVLTYSLERISQFNVRQELKAIDEKDLTIGTIAPSIRIDMRDDPLAPTQGLFSVLGFELANPVFLSQGEPDPVGFYRTQLRSDYVLPLGGGISWYMSFRTGLEKNLERNGTLPLIKQFSLGGSGSLRGFQEQELSLPDVRVTGSVSYVNYRTQIDFPFAGALRFGPFLDAANLLMDRYSFGALRYGTGAGFHYRTPVGPVNLDWGFKVNPRPGEDPYRFYFSIGLI